MRDKIVHNGTISCYCPKCNSKNVFYLKQKKVVLPFSPNNKIIHNVVDGTWYTLRTIKEKYLMFRVAWDSAKTVSLFLVCRDCGWCEKEKNKETVNYINSQTSKDLHVL